MISWALVVLGCLLLAFFASRYFTLDSESFFERQRAVYEDHKAWIIAHIAFMTVPTLLGPFQFLRAFRDKYRRVHRISGRLYIACAIAGALAGLYMSQYSASGTASDLGFAALAIGVLVTTSTALYMILNGRVQLHREWMTRSFALIFAAVTLRLYLAPLEAAFGEHTGYAITAWLCWVPNILVAEWIIRAHLRQQPERDFTPRRTLASDS